MKLVGYSGRSSLDFLGTLRRRRGPAPHDYLAQPSDLAEWAVLAGLVTEPPSVTAAGLARARELRETIHRVVLGAVEGSPPEKADVEALNAAAGRLPVRVSLGIDGAVDRIGAVPQLLSELARDALDLLGGVQIGLVRECDGADCTRLYVDSSRGHNRRWCSNADCGNRAKVSAFRRRARSS